MNQNTIKSHNKYHNLQAGNESCKQRDQIHPIMSFLVKCSNAHLTQTETKFTEFL